MTWRIVQGPQRVRLRGYQGRIWRYRIDNGLRTRSLEVKVSAQAMASSPSDLPPRVREARLSDGRSEIARVAQSSSPPTAIDVCRCDEAYPSPPALDDASGAGSVPAPVANWFSAQGLDLLLYKGDDGWYASALPSHARSGLGEVERGASPMDAAARLRSALAANDRPRGCRVAGETEPPRDDSLTSQGYRIVWSQGADSGMWRAYVYDEHGRFVDSEAGESRREAIARIRSSLEPAPVSRLKKWWRGLGARFRLMWRPRASRLSTDARLRLRLRKLATWAADHPSIVIPLSGSIIYAAVRVSYALFYSKVGVQPEEVGLNEARLLGQSVVAWFGLLVVTSAVALFFWLIGLWGQRSSKRRTLGVSNVDGVAVAIGGRVVELQRKGRIHIRPTGVPDQPSEPNVLSLIFAYALMASLMVFALWFVVSPLTLGSAARRGESVRPGIGYFFANPLGVRAERARVTVIRGPRRTVPAQAMYLGEANATTVLYDRGAQRVVRLPSAAIAVSTTVVPRFEAGLLRPGRYVSDTFEPSAVVQIPESGWIGSLETTDFLGMRRDLDSGNFGYLAFAAFPEETADELVARLRAMPFLRPGIVADAELAGVSGKAFEADVQTERFEEELFPIGGTADQRGQGFPFSVFDGERLRLVAADVDGRAIMAITEAMVEDFDEFSRTADSLLAELEFD